MGGSPAVLESKEKERKKERGGGKVSKEELWKVEN